LEDAFAIDKNKTPKLKEVLRKIRNFSRKFSRERSKRRPLRKKWYHLSQFHKKTPFDHK
jgi:hypothetical protein